MIYIWEDLNRFKGSHIDDEIKNIYDRFPETSCLCCGRCCWDSPEITFVEFLYAFDFFINLDHTRIGIINLYKKIFLKYLLSPIRDLPCAFLDSENKCIIHSASPYNCKRWGLQRFEDYQDDLKYAETSNDVCIEYFSQFGINISRSKTTDYCYNVKILKYNDRKILCNLENLGMEIQSINQNFDSTRRIAYCIHNFFLAAFFNEARLPNDRIRQLKKYQAGDKSAIDTFIESVDFESKLDTLLSRY